jgi:homocysteine S-methyltransferase
MPHAAHRVCVRVYPNSGKTYDAACGCWHGEDYLERYSVMAREWFDHGARIIGGCCRTGEYEIKALCCLRANLLDGGSRVCG